jgi:hypothetical protein
MTKDRLLRFAEACARKDSQRGIVQSESELQQGLNGYTACLALIGEVASRAIRPGSVAAAVETYKQRRGVIALTPAGRSSRVRRRRRHPAASTQVAWSGSLLRRCD